MSRPLPQGRVPWHQQSYLCRCGHLCMLVQEGTRVLEVDLNTPTYQATEQRTRRGLVLVRQVGETWAEHRCGGG